MIVPAEIVAGVTAAWRLARREPDALAWVDATPRGFWHSFFAAAIVLPAVLALELLDGTFAQEGREPLRTLSVELIAYVIQWTAFPLAMSAIADGLGRGQHYIRYIVVYNWSAVLQMALFLPVALMAAAFPGSGIMLAMVIATALLLIYQAYIAHVALEVPGPTAAGLVLLDMLLGGLVQMTADRIAG
ncbi:MAG: hypothetical protein AB1918_19390 [Pseudomonadota bacterium]